MKTHTRCRRSAVWVGVYVFCAAIVPRANAAILDTSAALAISAQEIIDGEPASFSQDDAVYPGISVELPLTASTRVESTDLDGLLVAVGQGFAEFAGPIEEAPGNPEELAIEVACYSNAPDVVYQVQGGVTETRTIVFTTNGNPLAPQEIQFRLDGTREIESRIYVSGAILIWTPDLDTDGDGFPNNSLDGLNVDARLSVNRLADIDDSEPTTLFDTSISIVGSGDMLSGPDTTGPIVVESSDVDALVAEGLDEESANVLRAVAERGTLTIVLIPNQEHPYRYEVRANETFLLRAELLVDIRNVAGGSGIAVSIGRPFSELTDFIEHALEGTSPATIEQSLNSIVAKSDVGLVPSDDTGASGAMCGALGIEIVPLALTLGFLPLRRRFSTV